MRCSNISANPPSKQQGGRHIIVIRAMGSVDRVITLGGGWGGLGNRRPGSHIYTCKYICIYIYIYIYIITTISVNPRYLLIGYLLIYIYIPEVQIFQATLPKLIIQANSWSPMEGLVGSSQSNAPSMGENST